MYSGKFLPDENYFQSYRPPLHSYMNFYGSLYLRQKDLATTCGHQNCLHHVKFHTLLYGLYQCLEVDKIDFRGSL